MKTAAELRKELRLLRRDMRTANIRKTSPFNGGMDRDTQRWNERRFALETQLETALKNEARSL